MSEIGDNNPPDMTITVGEVANDLSGWMAEHPVITNEDEAREAKVFVDRASLAIKDLEDERTTKVRPLNEEVKKINDHYRGPRDILDTVLGVLKARLGIFIAEEECRRTEIAEQSRQKAEEAERTARQAEELERDTVASANAGELGLDVGLATYEADTAFREYQKAARQAAVAERDAKVKIGGGFSRSLSLRSHETLQITDAILVIGDIGWTEDIRAAIIKGARAYRKLHNKLPAGIESIVERKA